jgi:hypothetical protein
MHGNIVVVFQVLGAKLKDPAALKSAILMKILI